MSLKLVLALVDERCEEQSRILLETLKPLSYPISSLYENRIVRLNPGIMCCFALEKEAESLPLVLHLKDLQKEKEAHLRLSKCSQDHLKFLEPQNLFIERSSILEEPKILNQKEPKLQIPKAADLFQTPESCLISEFASEEQEDNELAISEKEADEEDGSSVKRINTSEFCGATPEKSTSELRNSILNMSRDIYAQSALKLAEIHSRSTSRIQSTRTSVFNSATKAGREASPALPRFGERKKNFQENLNELIEVESQDSMIPPMINLEEVPDTVNFDLLEIGESKNNSTELGNKLPVDSLDKKENALVLKLVPKNEEKNCEIFPYEKNCMGQLFESLKQTSTSQMIESLQGENKENENPCQNTDQEFAEELHDATCEKGFKKKLRFTNKQKISVDLGGNFYFI